MAVLVNPSNADYANNALREVDAVARSAALQVQVLKASTIREINAAFATFASERPDIILFGQDPLFNGRRIQLVQLAARYGVPASYSARDYESYGANIADAWRQAGSYAGRIVKGAKPAELPVLQSSKFELVINTQTATMLGLKVPDRVLSIADEVIE